jgi:hypothetical protein
MKSSREKTREILQIVSWNINSDHRVEIFDKPPFMYTANAFKNYSVHKRFPMISASIDYFRDIKKVSLFAIQEIEDSILPELIKHFKSKGLEILSMKYNPSKLAFNYAFAYDPSLYACKSISQIYLTLSGKSTHNREILSKEELFSQHLDSEFERSSQLTELENINSKKQFVIVNNHFGLSNKHRLLASDMLCKKIADIVKPMVLVGDFNQFDANVKTAVLYTEQIKIFKHYGFKWVSECLQSQEPKGSFITFPYDINRFLNNDDFLEYDKLKDEKDYDAIRNFFVKKICEKDIPLFSTSLDGVFSKNMEYKEEKIQLSSCKAILFADGERIKPMPTAEDIQKMAVKSYQAGKCNFPSDHLPLLTKVRFG